MCAEKVVEVGMRLDISHREVLGKALLQFRCKPIERLLGRIDIPFRSFLGGFDFTLGEGELNRECAMDLVCVRLGHGLWHRLVGGRKAILYLARLGARVVCERRAMGLHTLL